MLRRTFVWEDAMPAPAFGPSFFDIGTGEAHADPAQGAAWVLDQIVISAGIFPEWEIEETARAATVSLRTRDETSAVLAAESGGSVVEIALRIDASGWIELTAGALRGWVDRPYEELDIWPDGAVTRATDAPGRMGKRMTWISLDARAWPMLQPLANPHGWVNLRVRD